MRGNNFHVSEFWRKCLILLLFFSFSSVFGQKTGNKISGILLDQNDSSRLEFAHVYIRNSNIGTYSNTNGEFVFYYPDSLVNDTLIISRVGYHEYSHALSKSDTSSSLTIIMQESKDYLDEVVVYAQQDTIVDIIKKVLKNFKKNYPTKRHYLEGFYRELSLKGDEYTRLIEASIGVTENNYRKDKTNTKIKIRQVRKSEDYREYSLKAKLYLATMKMVWGKRYADYNNISNLLKMNLAKIDHGKINVGMKELDFVEAFDFEVTKVSAKNERKFYHIKFQMPPSTSGATAYYGGELVIDMSDYAIVEWKYGHIPHPYKIIPKLDVMFYKGRFHRHYHIIYSKIDGKYYPTYFEMYEPILEAEKHIYEDGKEEFQYDKVTFMVNQVITRKRDFDRIKNREALEDDIDLYNVDHLYNSEFWANYNILLLDPLLKPAIEDLEKEKPLEKQFEDNGE